MTGFCALKLKLPLNLAISVSVSSLNFMLCRVEHETSFITSGQVGMALISSALRIGIALISSALRVGIALISSAINSTI